MNYCEFDANNSKNILPSKMGINDSLLNLLDIRINKQNKRGFVLENNQFQVS